GGRWGLGVPPQGSVERLARQERGVFAGVESADEGGVGGGGLAVVAGVAERLEPARMVGVVDSGGGEDLSWDDGVDDVAVVVAVGAGGVGAEVSCPGGAPLGGGVGVHAGVLVGPSCL